MAEVRVVHALPRRVRLKITALKGKTSLAHELEKALHRIPGVRRVDAGSLLIVYQHPMRWHDSIPTVARQLAAIAPHLDAESVARHLSTKPETRPGDPVVLEASDVTGFFAGVNQTVRSTTGGLDLKLLLPLALVLLDLLWFGFGTFMMLNAAGVPPARAAEEAAEVAGAL